MDTLDNTEWDVLIVGTGLQQSLLALALSRSGKKILHVDKNDYYGGAEAAFSLQEAEEWAKQVDEDSSIAAFTNISISKPQPTETDASVPSLSFSRAYSLALDPQIIYARSTLLRFLVSSKVYRQLEFLAVGSWWVYSAGAGDSGNTESASQPGQLLKVPNGREDVFQDQVMDFKTKRALMKFLRFITEYEEQAEVWEQHRQQLFTAFLSEQFKVPATLQAPLLALALGTARPSQTTTEFALPRIARHLRSIGVFGAGFGSVIPKWGGMSEITQVACRASAVGGGVYLLGKGLSNSDDDHGLESVIKSDAETKSRTKLRLETGEVVTTQWVIGEGVQSSSRLSKLCKSITIVSSPLTPLFPPIAEEAPAPACAVVVFPSGSLVESKEQMETPPVHIFVHSSDTGECPAGQSILYAFTSLEGNTGFQLLDKAVQTLLSTVEVTPIPTTLWSVRYVQHSVGGSGPLPRSANDHFLHFPPTSMDPAFDDAVLGNVREAWQKIMGDDGGEFLVFQDREPVADDDE
ncbi:hypothetical protein K504DRAFT_401904 [Pleomassaria siparia CBS 279.74]|uniref:Rab proteins geranylgeranyltransferase n=1 Tax=Pleomassaria siparia CBS 279.74 TaxID=1314801 RepID=A0A6G1KIS1_9PLEO|nr:hypothetical protein K504DRAFT_401904 [Pleomassaria siparia CBS 279.74]